MEKTTGNAYLQGNYAPVLDELTVMDLPVIGNIPKDLQGVYLRNGPNPAFPPIAYAYPFDGDGMIHGVYIKDGKASYRNRFVKTKGLLAEQRAGHAIYGGVLQPIMPDPNLIGIDGDPGPFKNGAFIHVIRHADHYLAMWEAGPAYEINRELDTLGEWRPGMAQPIPVNAHTRLDPRTGELFLITYDVAPPYLTYYQLDAQGRLKKTVPIEKPYPTMIHDFVLTENYVVIFDCPVLFKITDPTIMQIDIRWEEELPMRIGIIPRQSDNPADIIWIATEPFFVFHFANAYEKNNEIIVDFVWHASLRFDYAAPNTQLPPTLYRGYIDLKNKTFKKDKLAEHEVEFPRINEAFNSKMHRFIYLPTYAQPNMHTDKPFNSLLKFDTVTNTSIKCVLGEQCEIGEAVFAPKNNPKTEDDGYVMLFVYNRVINSSDFVIIDALQFADGPIATIKLPRRVPHGLHGSWLPDK
jgi:carotenoid cleavage dioxygenase